MLALTMRGIGAPSSSNGWRMTSQNPICDQLGSNLEIAPSIKTTNSSPPIRPMVSASRKRVLQSGGNRNQQPVTSLVTERVVHVLELVEIDVQRGADGPVTAAAGQELLDAVHDQRPVGQTGQPIVQRLIAQLTGLFAYHCKCPRTAGAQHVEQYSQ